MMMNPNRFRKSLPAPFLCLAMTASGLIPAASLAQSSFEIIQALEEVKSDLYERIRPGVVNIQVVRQDGAASMLSALGNCANHCLNEAWQKGEVTAAERDLLDGWSDSYVEHFGKELAGSKNFQLFGSGIDWKAGLRNSYRDWKESQAPVEGPEAEMFQRYLARLDVGFEAILNHYEALSARPPRPVVLHQSTGFLVRPGVVVTTGDTAHHRHPSNRIRVYSENEIRYATGVLVGTDSETNVAVIKLATDGTEPSPTIDLNKPGDPRVGSYVYAFYHPFNQPLSMCTGEITGGLRTLPVFDCAGFIETSLPTSPGTMGSPLVNYKGELVGMRTAFMGQGTMSEVTYALPADQLASVVTQILEHRQVARGCMGVFVEEVASKTAARKFVLVRKVLPGSPAQLSDLRTGDIILRANGRAITCRTTLLSVIASHRPEESVTLDYERDGERHTVQVSLAPVPDLSKH